VGNSRSAALGSRPCRAHRRASLARHLACAAAVAVAATIELGCSGGGASGGDKQVHESGVRFRARGDRFEIGDAAGSSWRPFFVKGVNLAIAKPGRFPGELAATYADYARWLQDIADLNCNTVRLYTLHFPAFYQAFGDYNRAHPDRPLYLIQGIWLDELAGGDFITDATAQLEEEIAYVVDAVHGAARIPERRGKAWGEYREDVSPFVLAWLPGSEMDGGLVRASDEAWPASRRYDGRYVSSPDGLPIEAWVARALDEVVARELDLYGDQRPVGWSNWPALDPIHHPTEPALYAQDAVDVDFGRFTTHGAFSAGLFVSYHVYPFNPEFICYDPGYAATIDGRGKPNSYLGYLLDLKAHHAGVPLLVAEYGVPSSTGVAHVNPTSFNHGGYSEVEQAANVADLFASIVESGAAGAVAFELLDEWFKSTWLTRSTTIPEERGPLWYDVLSPEESFGLVSFYPTASSIDVDGDPADWEGRGQLLTSQPAKPVAPLGDGRDGARTLRALYAAADPAYLFLRLDLGGASAADFEDVVLLLGVSTLGGATGDRLFPDVGVALPEGTGLEAVVVLDVKGGVAELRIDEQYDPSALLNGEALAGGEPVPNDAGRFVLSSLIINDDRAYVGTGTGFVPTVVRYEPGVLRRGNSTQDSLAQYQLGAGLVELRLPWHALWVTDPSSHMVLDSDPATGEYGARATDGLQFFVVAAARDGAALRVVDALPRAGFEGGSFGAVDAPRYLWPAWDAVDGVERRKPAFRALQQVHLAVP
jgi:hypothetical protein